MFKTVALLATGSREVLGQQCLLGEMSDRMHDDLVTSQFEDASMSLPATQSVQQLSNNEGQDFTFRCQRPLIRIVGQDTQLSLKSVEPADGLFGGPILGLPERVDVELQLCPRRQRNAEGHGTSPN